MEILRVENLSKVYGKGENEQIEKIMNYTNLTEEEIKNLMSL